MTMDSTLILASSSPRRRNLLAGLGLPFTVQASHVDEDVADAVPPGRFVEILAERKARAVASGFSGESTIVIGADTVVVLNGEILGKPRDTDHAFAMLQRLQGRTHQVYSGISLVPTPAGTIVTTHESTSVTMRSLTDAEIRSYIETGEPMDKAGSYAIQGIGATLVSRIEGDYFTVVGLPLCLLGRLLRDHGIDVLSGGCRSE